MPVYKSADSLQTTLQILYEAVQATKPELNQRLKGMVIHVSLSHPTLDVWIDGTQQPYEVVFGAFEKSPHLYVELSADSLHKIFLNQLSLRKAIGAKLLHVRGNFLKLGGLVPLFLQAQKLYPKVYKGIGG